MDAEIPVLRKPICRVKEEEPKIDCDPCLGLFLFLFLLRVVLNFPEITTPVTLI